MDSPINIELKIIARGIDSCAPITRGDKILDALTDKYKNKFTPTPIEKAKPNPGHLALVDLENICVLKHQITQNIDNLHYIAGSKHVTEIHGNRTKLRRSTRG